jgi:hypothetical protein
VPFTDDGAERLAAELERAHEVVDPPALVWLFDRDDLHERRGTVYGRRAGDPPRLLVVWRERVGHDCVEWVCEPFVRERNE